MVHAHSLSGERRARRARVAATFASGAIALAGCSSDSRTGISGDGDADNLTVDAAENVDGDVGGRPASSDGATDPGSGPLDRSVPGRAVVKVQDRARSVTL